MGKRFFVKFKDSSKPLEFEIYDQHISRSWYQLLEKALDWGVIREKDRFVNFSEDTREKNFIEINEVISELNKVWPEKAELISPDDEDLRDRLNYLHKLFEIYRGRINDPPEFYKNASPRIRLCLERLNVLIHQLEEERASPRFVVTFEHNLRRNLKPEHYDLFTTTVKFGVVYINYCDTGRELLEAFKAKDKVVGDDNLRPLTCYAADFKVYFPEKETDLLKEHEKERFEEFIKEKGFTVGAKENGIGRIPVAYLVTDITREEVIKEANPSLLIEDVYI